LWDCYIALVRVWKKAVCGTDTFPESRKSSYDAGYNNIIGAHHSAVMIGPGIEYCAIELEQVTHFNASSEIYQEPVASLWQALPLSVVQQ
jgi:hypothetical protein